MGDSRHSVNLKKRLLIPISKLIPSPEGRNENYNNYKRPACLPVDRGGLLNRPDSYQVTERTSE